MLDAFPFLAAALVASWIFCIAWGLPKYLDLARLSFSASAFCIVANLICICMILLLTSFERHYDRTPLLDLLGFIASWSLLFAPFLFIVGLVSIIASMLVRLSRWIASPWTIRSIVCLVTGVCCIVFSVTLFFLF